ncbi:hypothetical protein [Acinetobacter sp. TGL-Y2]|uniref:hypothetical protein n=1 Tax=Acinetobacter sp. TGL-Y2 TaxID=1407071 RepID=UPI001D17BF79|nr:hypothetical protein [Acinetobacter sp. TGL-Y2]
MAGLNPDQSAREWEKNTVMQSKQRLAKRIESTGIDVGFAYALIEKEKVKATVRCLKSA